MNEKIIPTADTKPIPPHVENEQWRDKPYLRFEGNLQRTQEVESLIEQHGSDGTLAVRIESYYQEKLAGTPEVGKQLAEIVVLKEELEKISAEQESINNLPDTEFDEAQPRFSELSKRSKSLLQKIHLLENDPDVVFFSHLKSGIENLHERVKAVELCQKDPTRYLTNKGGKIPFEEVIFSDYSVTYVVSQEVWEKHVKGTAFGVHYNRTVINIVRRNPDAEREGRTIRHENKHAIFETFFGDQADTFGVKQAERTIAHILKGAQEGLPKEWIKEVFVSFQQQIWKEYLSGIKNELIANFEGLSKGSISSDFTIYRRLFSWLEKQRDKLQETKGFVYEALGDASERLKAECQKFYVQLSDILFIAEKEGLAEDVHSAMLLFDPLDYKKIEQYLIWKVGKEKYATHQALRRIIRAPFFVIPEPPLNGQTLEEKLLEAIERENNPFYQAAKLESNLNGFSKENVERFSLSEFTKMKLTIEDRLRFDEVVRDIIDNHIEYCSDSLLQDEPAYVSTYLDKVVQICKIAGTDANMEDMRQSIWAFYIYGKTNPFVEANDPESARKFVLSIRPEEKEYLSEALHALREGLDSHDLLGDQKWLEVLRIMQLEDDLHFLKP